MPASLAWLIESADAVLAAWFPGSEAGNAIDALKARLAINARVKRDGKWVNPAARELVPGDGVTPLVELLPHHAKELGLLVLVQHAAHIGEEFGP